MSALRGGPPMAESTPDHYWQRAHDRLFNLKVDHYGPDAFYRLEKKDDTHHEISVFFLTRRYLPYLAKQLKAIGLSPTIAFNDKSIKKYEQGDTIYTSLGTLFVRVPNERIAELQEMMAKARIANKTPTHKSPPLDISTNKNKPPGTIDVVIYWNRTELFTLSFQYHALPSVIMRSLNDRFGLIFKGVSGEEDNNLHYKLGFIMLGCSVYDAIRGVEDTVADIISALEPYITEEPSLFSGVGISV